MPRQTVHYKTRGARYDLRVKVSESSFNPDEVDAPD